MTNRIHIFDDEQGKVKWTEVSQSQPWPRKIRQQGTDSVCLSSDVQGCTVASASRMGKLRASFYVSNRERPTWSPGLGHNDPICASLGQGRRER